MPKRIIIVDDHEVVRQGVKRILSVRPEWEVVSEANNGDELLETVKACNPDLVVLDISMPGQDGLEIMGRLLRMDASTKVIILTMHESKELSFRIKSLGGAGYVVKTSAASDLVRAVDNVFEGGTFFPADPGVKATSKGAI